MTSITDALLAAAASADSTPPVVWWIGGIIVAVAFGAMVWRTIRRNRLK
ncbi:hypothetical protein [Gulosibacter faecalis]|jgi:hypothetical protein|uniref:LPXTG cell wall anchor domain-containing protein n=1 Tax=Gulosibacter faecalis TaxID=272240 RepID=A0ABW5UZK3_9MICO|nr:hypothetical protein [Gulosibacter faecalis]